MSNDDEPLCMDQGSWNDLVQDLRDEIDTLERRLLDCMKPEGWTVKIRESGGENYVPYILYNSQESAQKFVDEWTADVLGDREAKPGEIDIYYDINPLFKE